MAKVNFNFYVLGLITGRESIVKIIDKETGSIKIVKEFIPSVTNRYPRLKDLMISKNKSYQEIAAMEGLICPELNLDREVFKKSIEEKKLLKSIKSSHNQLLKESGFLPSKRLNLSKPQTIIL